MKLTRGLDIPIAGTPEQKIDEGSPVTSVAVVGPDFIGLKPTFTVQEGDKVLQGQVLFTDKRNPSVKYTSPGTGIVKVINRGERRALQSVVIELNGDEQTTFHQYDRAALASLSQQQVVDNLLDSGLWTSLRTRPYSKIASLEQTPSSIFVTAMSSEPLSAEAGIIIQEQKQAFLDGLTVMSQLTDQPVHVCKSAGTELPISESSNVHYHDFSGPHPAGLVGTHIHFLDPVTVDKVVWYINYQDVIAVGKLFTTGFLPVDRVVALSGPLAVKPRLVRTRLGANLTELISGECEDEEEVRIVSGSVLSGREVEEWSSFLGRFHLQVSLVGEGRQRHLFGWLNPAGKKYSLSNVYLNSVVKGRQLFTFNTNRNGSARAMVPTGSYEKVMPQDMLPTQLLRALLVGDTDVAQQLGCLELDEEDLALCTFVCHSKHEFGSVLRRNLEQIEKEG
ncbi:MAG: Na(+)-translocating NADH-quinone reductase subunit A [Gammaproteobacteria bacterium]|nr:Na(+)-translocating NADH-quinone reductase subunit A [Gammaproteobacteria bacterium]